MSTSTKPDVCQKHVPGHWNYGTRSGLCGRELRTPEQVAAGLCGPHLAGKRRSEKARAVQDDRGRESDERKARAEHRAREFHDLGLDSARPDWDWCRRLYTGCIVLGEQDAELVIRALREGRGKGS